jgi:g-D-glutamyl-meso-diaminopimelate peptidase
VIGHSTLGQEILCYHVGSKSGPQILIEASIHAREYPSTLVVLGIVEYLINNPPTNGGVYIVPLINPDGVRLVLDGADSIKCEKLRQYALDVNNGNEDFSQWKADIWAVDLNVNFDALWGGGSQNVQCPEPGNFIGFYPNSEREVRNLIDFSYLISPDLTLSYHTKGEVIYYGFEVLTPDEIERDKEYADLIASVNGYTPIKTENSTGGYSDWVSEYLRVPSFTVEVGNVTEPTPLPLSVVPDAIERNKKVPLVLLERLNSTSTQNIKKRKF